MFNLQLDYEIDRYEVCYHTACDDNWVTATFNTENEAVYFISKNRHKWDNFILRQIRTAIIF